ncbi:exoribonuclease R [Microbacterium sorbitolivorans]|uniref:RNB domain-containing ribonuclease n=1 Tax=Microbacterium sorbitolivorans TaxID=1867410 RepID=A0A367YAA7_9MICO|nr:RNB domain-containing ribonuclease [Microbacterium sorbitolivorans]RCK61941.1 RNB domain-containing ribonuclease [Microbacterium sorbitolivorans]GGF44449.1 exoribonuclease R [Microbacterium sorbitolivorans]
MTARKARLSSAARALAESFAALRAELQTPVGYPDDAVEEAERVIAAGVAVDGSDDARVDMDDVPFLTIDPEGSRDLDQAMHLERDGDGYVVQYAIADLAAIVAPGGALDAATQARGQTLYAPDGSTGLHPEQIAGDAASLLPEQRRRAYVWRFALGSDGRVTDTQLVRAWVRSRKRWTYTEVQAELDAGTAPEGIALLAEIGARRIELEAERGGASLRMSEEEVVEVKGQFELRARATLASEDFNAQISLMTGMAAAELMLRAKVGILRTMPPADQDAIDEFRRRVALLDRPWSTDISYGEYLRQQDPGDHATPAVMQAATALFRGAGYEAFDGEAPEQKIQSAIAAPYSHATAPLRRLVDRYVLAICEAEANGTEIPAWAREALPQLPKIMGRSGQLASRLENGCIARVEAAVLSHRIGREYVAVAVSRRSNGTRVQIATPFITADVEGEPELGSIVRVRVDGADIAAGTVSLSLVGASPRE